MCDIIWPPAPLKICYLARNTKELHEPALYALARSTSDKSSVVRSLVVVVNASTRVQRPRGCGGGERSDKQDIVIMGEISLSWLRKLGWFLVIKNVTTVWIP